ncbi:hypothetical protein QNH39_23585 [Neobacillus novalis]|uniref:Lipoprotein n=1 Tax=Neobacillus novalis TaxID=220687 RepID=A0AA95SBZ4_9BACI|nr:hypothetical protein [Neobacillus novalis]WHY85558.1 hypothetical protein QNH39_23585 [Neobacillus novalis]
MKKFYLLFLIVIILVGCQTNNTIETNKTFLTYKSAVEYGLQEEGITKDDIIDEIQVGGEQFIIFINPNLGDSIATANINVDKNGTYTWNLVGSRVVFSMSLDHHTPSTKGEIQLLSGKKFNVYLGMDETNLPSMANGEELKYDEKRKIYYNISENTDH